MLVAKIVEHPEPSLLGLVEAREHNGLLWLTLIGQSVRFLQVRVRLRLFQSFRVYHVR
jgi:hypothetical protein